MKQHMRGQGIINPADPEKIGLPMRPFLYTIDQICVLLNLSEPQLRAQYLFYEGRSTGIRKRSLIVARNIAPPIGKPEWRVAERELIRWFKFKGFKVYEVGVVSD